MTAKLPALSRGAICHIWLRSIEGVYTGQPLLGKVKLCVLIRNSWIPNNIKISNQTRTTQGITRLKRAAETKNIQAPLFAFQILHSNPCIFVLQGIKSCIRVANSTTNKHHNNSMSQQHSSKVQHLAKKQIINRLCQYIISSSNFKFAKTFTSA